METNDQRVERLTKLLAEHECWEHPGWDGSRPYTTERMQHEIQIVLLLEGYPVAIMPPEARALRAAISGVESSSVLGAPDRCAVCGEKEATLNEWPQERTWLCGAHSSNWEPCCIALRRAREQVWRAESETLRDRTRERDAAIAAKEKAEEELASHLEGTEGVRRAIVREQEDARELRAVLTEVLAESKFHHHEGPRVEGDGSGGYFQTVRSMLCPGLLARATALSATKGGEVGK